jgi:hypothetical protein
MKQSRFVMSLFERSKRRKARERWAANETLHAGLAVTDHQYVAVLHDVLFALEA